MRTIIFRGKRKDNGDWVYGDLEHLDNGNIHIFGNRYSQPVEENTIGQFTGCVDKNGQDIYEDDVVLLKDNKVAIVKYEPNLFGFYADFLTLDQWDMEVIGNIHDNPRYNR